jgi:amino acid adenylation domain-containing protein
MKARNLIELKARASERRAGRTTPHKTFYPLTLAQEGIWILEQLSGSDRSNILPFCVEMQGEIDRVALAEALNVIIRRHDALRTTIRRVDGDMLQVVEKHRDHPVELIDLRGSGRIGTDEHWRDLISRITQCRFDLAEPSIRLMLFPKAETSNIFVLIIHHICFDRQSLNVFLYELWRCYSDLVNGRAPTLGPVQRQCGDFALFQRRALSGFCALHLPYWRDQLTNVQPLRLHWDSEAGQRWTGPERVIRLPIDRKVLGGLRNLASRGKTTLFVILLSVFYVVLFRFTGTQDLCILCPFANRTRSEYENTIGCLLNLVALRTKLNAEQNFCDLLSEVRTTFLKALEHQDLPFETLVEHLDVPGGLGRVSDVLFNHLAHPFAQQKYQGVKFQRLDGPDSWTNTPLSVFTEESEEGLSIWARYRTDLRGSEMIESMLNCYEVALQNVDSHWQKSIRSLPMLTASDRHRILRYSTGPLRRELDEVSVQALFEAQAIDSPEALAVECGPRRLSYSELNARANRIAHLILSRGLGGEARIGVLLEASVDFVVGVLGVLKAGAAYIPLDPKDPEARLALILADSGVELVITQASLAGRLPPDRRMAIPIDAPEASLERFPAENPSLRLEQNSLAYIIYTSGSTGRPKGVCIENKALAGYIKDAISNYAFTKSDRILQFASSSFDASVEEIFGSICSGATLVFRSDGMMESAQSFLDGCNALGVTVCDLPTSYWRYVASHVQKSGATVPESIRLVVIGGEAAHSSDVMTWRQPTAPRATLLNSYGPTEATIVATLATLASSERDCGPVRIGKPIGNCRTYVLDDDMSLVPLGVPGELYIGGTGLARGYLDRPGLTAAAFVPDPLSGHPGERLFRTGDLARFWPDGAIEFLGRADDQVKVRGYRVELSAIEATLLSHADVCNCAVVKCRDTADIDVLSAHIVRNKDATVEATDLSAYLARQLPHYMLPASYTFTDELPRTPGGKVDRHALASVGPNPGAARSSFQPPITWIEKRIAEIWTDAFQHAPVGLDDDFFAFGGHSLVALRLIDRVRTAFGADISLGAFFENPTVRHLCLLINAAGGRRIAMPPKSARPSLEERKAPLSHQQRALWSQRELLSNVAFHMSAAYHLRGPLDTQALERSLDALVSRHEALRSSIEAAQDNPVQVISSQMGYDLEVETLHDVADAEIGMEVIKRMSAERITPFDLGTAPLFRAKLLSIEPGSNVLLVTVHHIIADGWSLQILFRELTDLYSREISGTRGLRDDRPLQYADYAMWQQQWLGSDDSRAQLAYWVERLSDIRAPLPPGPKRDDATVRGSYSDRTSIEVPQSLWSAFNALGQEESCSTFMTLVALIAIVLRCASGEDDIRICTMSANRSIAGTENAVGLFANSLILRTPVQDTLSVREFLGRVRRIALEGYKNDAIPFNLVLDALEAENEVKASDLANVLLIHERSDDETLRLAGIHVTTLSNDFDIPHLHQPRPTSFDLIFYIEERTEPLVQIEYRSSLFERPAIDALLSRLLEFMKEMVEEPSKAIGCFPSGR